MDQCLQSDEAALCGPIRTELLRGFRSPKERTRCWPLLEACHQLSGPDDLWNEAGELGFLLARKGLTAKSFDLLIATFALAHAVPVLTIDRDFELMPKQESACTLPVRSTSWSGAGDVWKVYDDRDVRGCNPSCGICTPPGGVCIVAARRRLDSGHQFERNRITCMIRDHIRLCSK